MKKILFSTMAVIACFSATAQRSDTTSTVIGKKLNFEAPLFGVTVKNVKPTWSLVVFGEVNLGYSYALNVPGKTHIEQGTTGTGDTVEYADYAVKLHSGGISGDLSLLELRLRPWRDGNLFFCGLNLGFESHSLPSGYLFNKDNEPVLVRMTNVALASYKERMLSLEIGYVREMGDWSFGLQLFPGIGHSLYRNNYDSMGAYMGGEEGIDLHRGGKFPHRRDDAIGQLGLRFGARADVWYRAFGAFVSVRPAHTGYNGGGPEYTTVSAGLSIRY